MDISVVMSAFNAEATVEAAVKSLLRQRTTAAVEVIIVDDGSTDSTVERVGRLIDDRIRLISLGRNVGRAQARNVGVAATRAKLVAIADADDVAHPDRLTSHLAAFARSSSLAVHGGQLSDLIGNRVFSCGLLFPDSQAGVDAAFSGRRMGIAHPASAFRKDWFEATGGYDPQLRWCEDYDLFARGWARGSYSATADVLIAYRREARIPSWHYWWENARHTRAINDRLLAGARTPTRTLPPISDFVDRRSGRAQQMFERVHFEANRLRHFRRPGMAPTSLSDWASLDAARI